MPRAAVFVLPHPAGSSRLRAQVRDPAPSGLRCPPTHRPPRPRPAHRLLPQDFVRDFVRAARRPPVALKMARAPTPTGPSLVPLYPGPAPRLLRGEGPHVNPGLITPPTIETENLNRNRVKSRLLAGESLQIRLVRERPARVIVRPGLHRYLSATC